MSRILIGICIKSWNNDFNNPSRWNSNFSFHVYLLSLLLSTNCPLSHISNMHLPSTNCSRKCAWEPVCILGYLSECCSPQCVWLHNLAHSCLFYTLCKLLCLLLLWITQKSQMLLCMPPWLHLFCFVCSFDANKTFLTLLKCLNISKKCLRHSWFSCLSFLINAVFRW